MQLRVQYSVYQWQDNEAGSYLHIQFIIPKLLYESIEAAEPELGKSSTKLSHKGRLDLVLVVNST